MLFHLFQNLIYFQIYQESIMKENRKVWREDEDEYMKSLVRKFGYKKWGSISDKMKQRFPEIGRSGKQCRQRWYNHLKPDVNKQPWTSQQLKTIFDSHKKSGNKWTQIAVLLQGRTDNAVKNQFYSSLRKGLRRICKVLSNRNITKRVKKIKPCVLSSILSNINELTSENQIYDILFSFSQGDHYYQLKKNEVSDKQKDKLQALLQNILESSQISKKKRIRNFQRKKQQKKESSKESEDLHQSQFQFLKKISKQNEGFYSQMESARFVPLSLGSKNSSKMEQNELQMEIPEKLLMMKKSSSRERSYRNKIAPELKEKTKKPNLEGGQFFFDLSESPLGPEINRGPKNLTPIAWQYSPQQKIICPPHQDFDEIVKKKKQQIEKQRNSQKSTRFF